MVIFINKTVALDEYHQNIMKDAALERRQITLKFEVDALGVITISRGCFERCGSNKKTPP